MKKAGAYLFIIYILSAGILFSSNAQTVDPTLLLENLFTRTQLTNNDSLKIALNDSIDLVISQYTKSDSVLSHRFVTLRNLGQIASPDSKLKIINWNLILRDGSNRYFLYLIREGEKKGSQNQVFALKGESKTRPPDSLKTYDEKSWYGALYYSIQPFRHGKSICYLILGIDFGKELITRKMIDILTFDETGKPLFGKDIFVRNGKAKSRHVIEYSSDGLISLKLETRKLVVFDHISPYSTGHGNTADYLGAGLSFDGYRLKKGYWEFVQNVDVRNNKNK